MRMREPFNGASHLLGLLLALYGASTLYHSLLLPERPPRALRTLDAPVWVSTGSYLVMGYLALAPIVPLARAVARGRPDPFPGRFGHHEICHILVLAGSACHYAFMLYHVA